MKLNHFQLIGKKELNCFSRQIPINQANCGAVNQFRKENVKLLILFNKNNPSSTTNYTSAQFSEGSYQGICCAEPICVEKSRSVKVSRGSRPRWTLISLVMFLVIILWLSNSGYGKFPAFYRASVDRSCGCRLSVIPV